MAATALESTATLLAQVRQGDKAACDRLVQRYLPALRRWAHGRLPAYARDLLETDDLVQITLLRALDHVEGFESRRDGGFAAYLRRILMNRIRDELRATRRRPQRESLSGGIPEEEASPLEAAIGRESLERYERALEALSETQRESVIMRLEMGFSHREIAKALALSTPDAARMLIARAVVRLGELLDGSR